MDVDLPAVVQVACSNEYENDWSRALGIELPQDGSAIVFDVADDGIKKIDAEITEVFLFQLLDRFAN